MIASSLLTAAFCAALRLDVGEESPAGVQPSAVWEEGLPTLFSPRESPGEAQDDQRVAASHFAHGYLLLQRGDDELALRQFQRAWRYDPDAREITRELMALAGRLERRDEAGRYAILAAERHPRDGELLRRLGELLVERNELPRALRMFQKVLELESRQPPSGSVLVLRIEIGRLQFILGEHAQAAESFAAVRDALQDPQRFGLTSSEQQSLLKKPTRLYGLMGESFLLAGRLDEAVMMFRQAHPPASDGAILAYQLARIDALRKDWPSAQKNLDQYLLSKSSAAGVRPYELLGQILAAGSSNQAQAKADLLARIESLYRDDPANVPLGYFLAQRRLDAGNCEGSESVYCDLLQRGATQDAFQALCAIYRRRADALPLIRLLGQAVHQTANLDLLGPTLQQIADDDALVQKVVQRGEKLLEESPDDFRQDERVAVSLLALAAGQCEAAGCFCQAALAPQAQPNPALCESLGFAMYLAGQSARAASIFQQAITQSTDKEKIAAYYFYLAGALEASGRTEEAVQAARQAAASRAESARFQARPAWVLYHAKRFDQAQEEYLKLLAEFDPQYTSAATRETVREARLILSNICLLQGKVAQSEEWLEQVLDEFPEDAAALNDLGYLWADQGRHLQRALDMTRQASDAEPDNVAYRDSLGWAYFRLEKYPDAIRELERASRGDRPEGVILDHLGDAYWESNQVEKAITCWKKAAETFRGTQETENLKKTEAKLKQHAVSSTPASYGPVPKFCNVSVDRQRKEKGTDPFCRNGPQGAAHKRGLSPFPPRKAPRALQNFCTGPYPSRQSRDQQTRACEQADQNAVVLVERRAESLLE